MFRHLVVSLSLTACGGREVSKVKYTHTSCTDCGIEPGGPPAAPPDSDLPVGEQSSRDAQAAPPEPTCRLAAESIIAIELGNYADADVREPKVADAERRCARLQLSRDDRQCVVEARDLASVAYCVPALAPGAPRFEAVTAAECDSVGLQMSATLQRYAQGVVDGSALRAWERQLRAAIESCHRDRWNAELASCARTALPIAPYGCSHVQPTLMVQRLAARLAASP